MRGEQHSEQWAVVRDLDVERWWQTEPIDRRRQGVFPEFLRVVTSSSFARPVLVVLLCHDAPPTRSVRLTGDGQEDTTQCQRRPSVAQIALRARSMRASHRLGSSLKDGVHDVLSQNLCGHRPPLQNSSRRSVGEEVPSGVEPYRDTDGTKDRTVEVASHEVSGAGHRPPR